MPLLTTRRALWLPGIAVLAACAGIAALLGISLQTRSWPLYLGFLLGALLCIGWLERFIESRRVPAPPRARGKLKVIRGGKSDYDLEKDDRTDQQRYLM
jgi:hypothetical protein